MWISIDWLDRLIEGILVQKVNMLRVRVEETEKLLTFSKNQLKKEKEQLNKKEGPTSILDYAMEAFKTPNGSR